MAKLPAIKSISTNSVVSDTTLTINKPTGTIEGDLLVAFFLSDRAATAVTVPDGWTAYYENVETVNRSFAIYYKFAGSSEPADYTFTTNDTGGIVIGITRISDAGGFDGIEVTQADDGTNVAAPSLTTTVDDCLILRAAFFSWPATFGSWSKGVELWDMRHTSSGVNTGGAQTVAWDIQLSAGETGTASVTSSNSSYNNTITLAIAPKPVTPDIEPPLYDEFVSGDIVGAWGLRQLVSTYDGPLVRIRDTNDNSEQDIGFDETGALASFSVVGDAAVVTLYDQSGNGADLIQSSTSSQPLLLMNATPVGGHAIKFDGDDDFLRDGTLGTTRPYMVETPTLIFAGGGVPGGNTNGALATIPHSQPSNGAPWQRFGILRNLTSATTVALYRDGATSTVILSILQPSSGWGALAWSAAAGKVYEGVPDAEIHSVTTDASISYPSSTGFCIGGAGTADNWPGYFTECAIIDTAAPDDDEFRTLLSLIKANTLTAPKQVWRIRTAQNFAGSLTSHAFAEWELAETASGADVTASGQNWFQSIAASNEPASRLFDDNNSTNWWSNSSPVGPYFIGVDLNASYEIVEMRLRAGTTGSTAMPRNFTISYLAPGAVWVDVANVDLTSEGVSGGQVYTIPITYPASGIEADLTLDYAISLNANLTLDYAVLADFGVNLTLDYAILEFYADLILDYAIPLETDLTLNYKIEQARFYFYELRIVEPTSAASIPERAWPPTLTLIDFDDASVDDGAINYFEGFINAAATAVTHMEFYDDYYERIWVDPDLLRLSNPKIGYPYAFGVWNAYSFANDIETITLNDTTGVAVVQETPIEFERYQYRTLHVSIDASAPAKIEGHFDFEWSVGTAELYIIATVVSLIANTPEVPVQESWNWLTSIMVSANGNERRFALRQEPRTRIEYTILIENEAQRAEQYRRFMNFISRDINIPFFQYATRLTAKANQGDTEIFFDPSKTDIRDGEFVALFNPQSEATVLVKVATVEADGATLDSELDTEIPKTWLVVPTVKMRFPDASGFGMMALTGSARVAAESLELREFLRPNEAAEIVTYDDYPVMWQRPLADDEVDEVFSQNVEWLDNNSGNPAPYTSYPIPFISGTRVYKLHRPADMDYWRKLCDTLKGRQNPFLLPTYRDDLPLFEAPNLGASILRTAVTDYAALVAHNTYKRLQIETVNGIVYRTVIAVDDDGSGVIEISLDEPLGTNEGDNEIKKVSYLNVCRLNDDRVELEHLGLESFIRFKIRSVNE